MRLQRYGQRELLLCQRRRYGMLYRLVTDVKPQQALELWIVSAKLAVSGKSPEFLAEWTD